MALNPLDSLPENNLTIKRALLSVSNKQGIVQLATALHSHGIELISTGGTSKTIANAGIPVHIIDQDHYLMRKTSKLYLFHFVQHIL